MKLGKLFDIKSGKEIENINAMSKDEIVLKVIDDILIRLGILKQMLKERDKE